jgi:hypothetical protein
MISPLFRRVPASLSPFLSAFGAAAGLALSVIGAEVSVSPAPAATSTANLARFSKRVAIADSALHDATTLVAMVRPGAETMLLDSSDDEPAQMTATILREVSRS